MASAHSVGDTSEEVAVAGNDLSVLVTARVARFLPIITPMTSDSILMVFATRLWEVAGRLSGQWGNDRYTKCKGLRRRRSIIIRFQIHIANVRTSFQRNFRSTKQDEKAFGG